MSQSPSDDLFVGQDHDPNPAQQPTGMPSRPQRGRRRRAHGVPARSRRTEGGRRRIAAPKAKTPSAIDEKALVDLARRLAQRDGLGRYYTVRELRVASATTDAQALLELLMGRPDLFEPHRRTSDRFRVRLEVAPEVADAQLNGRRHRRTRRAVARHQESGEPMDQNTALLVARSRLEGTGALHKISARNEERVLVLAFFFPAVAQSRFGSIIEQLQTETGWTVEVRPEPHQGALSEASLKALPQGWSLRRNPAIRVADGVVTLHVDGGGPDASEAQEAAARFLTLTGFTLRFSTQDDEAFVEDASAMSKAELADDGQGPMELNQTYAAIHEVMEDAEHEVLKTSFRGDHVEVAFISPEIGERYRGLLDEVEELTGWTVTIKPHADQHRIKELAKTLVPEGCTWTREPQFLASARLVRIQLDEGMPEPEAAAEADRLLRAQTGHRLEFYLR